MKKVKKFKWESLPELDYPVSKAELRAFKRGKILVRGLKVEIFRKGKWYRPKRRCKGMRNPVACLRDMLIRCDKYDKSLDKEFGKFYRWCDGKVSGVVL